MIYAQALTACFAGPVFNLLVTLGVGFLIRLDNFQERRMRVASNDGISVGLGMIIANCVCVVLVIALALLFSAAPEGDD